MNTKFLKALVAILLLITTNARSEVVKDLVINGNKRVSDETIVVYGGIQINQDYSEEGINKILKNLYAANPETSSIQFSGVGHG